MTFYQFLIEFFQKFEIAPNTIRLSHIQGNNKTIYSVTPKGYKNPVYLVKFIENDTAVKRLRRENEFLLFLEKEWNEPRIYPKPIYFHEKDGAAIFVQRYIPGKSLSIHLLKDTILGHKKGLQVHFNKIFDWWTSIQDKSQKLNIYSDFKLESKHRKLLLDFQQIENEINLPIFTAPELVFEIGENRLSQVLEHGDFCPDNVLINDKQIILLDYEWSIFPGLPLWDTLNYILYSLLTYKNRGKQRGLKISLNFFKRILENEPDLSAILTKSLQNHIKTIQLPAKMVNSVIFLYMTKASSTEDVLRFSKSRECKDFLGILND